MLPIIALISLFTFVGCSTSLSGQHINTYDTSFEVHGHRGARTREPENSLIAYRHAVEHGANVIEADMTLSKDDVVIMNHEPYVDFKRCAWGGDGNYPSESKIEFLTLNLSQINDIECGLKGNPRFPQQARRMGIKHATLRELLSYIKGLHTAGVKIGLNLETKIPQGASDAYVERFITKIIETIEIMDIAPEHVVIQSFDFRSLKATRQLKPEYKISALVWSEDKNLDWNKTIGDLKPDYLSPYYKLVTPELIKLAQERNWKVVPWTINNSEDWKKLIDLGVDGIITDDPKELVAYLLRKNQQKRSSLVVDPGNRL